MMKFKGRTAAAGLMVGASVFGAVSASAQTGATPPVVAADTVASDQLPDDAPSEAQDVVVTGTRFGGRLIAESPVPIDSVSNADLRKGGYTQLEDQLKVQVPSFSIPRPATAGAVDFYTAPSLRGLSPGQLLVLVNGKRRHSSGDLSIHNQIGRGDVAYDLNAIPSAALGRVEVLRDGASAQYGSDAIAGVINLVLDRSIGAGVDTTLGITDKADGETADINAWLGVPLGDGGFVRTTLSYRTTDGTNRARPDTRQQYFGSDGTLMPSGNYGSGTGLTASNGTLDPREATVDRDTFRLGEPEYNQKSAFVNAELPLAPGIDLYGFGGYSRLDGKSIGFARRAGQDETVRALHPDGYAPVVEATLQNASGTLGVRGDDLAGFGYDVSTVYGGSIIDIDQVNSNNPSLGAASPTRSYRGGTRFFQWTTNADLTREIPLGDTSPLKLAFGYEHREEYYRIVAGDTASYTNGGVAILDGPNAGKPAAIGFQANSGITPEEARKESRNSEAVYVELEKTFGPLLISGAGRYESFSDFGDTTNYKLAARLQLAEPLALRGSISTGFRAPQLPQSYFATTSMTIVNGAQTSSRLLPVSNPVARLLGATDLKPEKSDNLSIGAVLTLPGLSASVDLYQIKVKDRIALSSTFQGAAVTSLLAENGFTGISAVSYLTNAVDTTSRGVDLTARYIHDFGAAGKLTTTLAANYNKQSFDRIAGTPQALADLGVTTPLFDLTQQVRFTDSLPRDKVTLDFAWDWKAFTLNLSNTRYGRVGAVAFTSLRQDQIDVLTPGYDVDIVAIDGSTNSQVIQYFGAKIITDLNLAWRATEKMTLTAGISNLFDTYPDKNIASTAESVAVGTNGSDNAGIFPYNYISPFGYSGRAYYLKAGFRF
ncbi:TonB-dependent receptor [Sphingomonas sp. PL-96]|uniref:TonB-dependent receptor plug domain-containing protein n=1 Tax=Sphingomonas sp. PL-96 TaxID=2887201 RepID=UPI001E3069E7|nr:TonB-dependent receptor [Sphingomonas sp. PL-96]MCC2978334.1 TonB-dependent receptor [Sphingomonas sp. PL-96]